MTPVDVRRRARAEHRSIERSLARLEASARAVPADAAPARRRIERELEALRERVHRHLGWEEGALARILPEADARGNERAARVGSAHAELREVLDFCRHACAAEHPVVVARRAHDLARLLRSAIRDEERLAVRRDLLREDVVPIDPVIR